MNFAVSPNERLIATTHKNYLTKVFYIDSTAFDNVPSAGVWINTTPMQTFKTTNQLGLEVCFDPSSRYVAIGTSDSHVKVFDTVKGFQTHNFMGHRGVIVQLAFLPQADALKLISSGEDFTVRVWDLVLNSEIACLRGTIGRVTSFAFSQDQKTLVVGAKDSKIAFYNILENYK